jgi:hypothetical protein
VVADNRVSLISPLFYVLPVLKFFVRASDVTSERMVDPHV